MTQARQPQAPGPTTPSLRRRIVLQVAGVALLVSVGLGTVAYVVVHDAVVDGRSITATLMTLGRTLVVAGAVATALGALIGWGLSRRVLRPLSQVGRVAEQIAAGRLDTRLAESADRDLARLTTSFNRMASTLEQRIAMEARFSADVSHELRSPLTTLATSVSVLEGRRDELSIEGREALDLLAADLRRFQALVIDLIEVSKHDAGVVKLERTYFAVAPFVRNAVVRLGVDGVAVDAEAQVAETVVHADQRRLERTLANLLDNARVHGGGPVRVAVSADDANVRIAVEDAGPGVHVDDRTVIFERFARGAHGRRTGSGSGLGLALATENMRAQGGRIWVEDRAGGGARFVLELPRVEL